MTDALLLALAWLTLALCLWNLIEPALAYPAMKRLTGFAPLRGENLPKVSIVAAARNEAAHVEAAARSLLAQDYGDLEIIIVDDRSEDATGAILDRLAEEHPRLQVVHVRELPPGWLGKNHALNAGAERALGAYLLFTDADVVMAPDAVARAVRLIEEGRLDHIAAAPRVTVPTVAGRWAVEAFGVYFLLFARPWKAKDPRSWFHIGIGAFNLVRATAYRAAGGHARIPLRPDDDMKLGKILKHAGFRQEAVWAGDTVTVEWVPSLRGMVESLKKNAFAGAEYSVALALAFSAGLLVFAVWPVPAVFVTSGAVFWLNAGALAARLALFWTVGRMQGLPFGYHLFFPLAAPLFLYILWRSALYALRHGGIEWRGTHYPLAELKRNRV